MPEQQSDRKPAGPPLTYDVIVVGVGAVGALACRALARRGASVLGLDRFAIPNAQASYHGESRVFRTAYYEHSDYVPLLLAARQNWLDLQSEMGEQLYIETGGLYMGRPDSAFVQGCMHGLDAHGLTYEQLDRATLGQRYPQWTVPSDFMAVVEPFAGVLLSESIVPAAAQSAVRHGAHLHEHEPVREWTVSPTGVIVTTERAQYIADRLVICAGAWSIPLLGSIGDQLTVTRQALAWFQPGDPESFQPSVFPIWGLDTGDAPFHYGFPILRGHSGVKLAHHTPGPPTTPQTIDRTPTAAEIDTIRSAARTYLPGADGELLRAAVCMYTNSPDGHFIIDVHPDTDRVVFCAGLSGHGFKFASVLCEALADLAVNGHTGLPIGFLSLKRFG